MAALYAAPNQSRVVDLAYSVAGTDNLSGSTLDGSCHFMEVLNEVYLVKNEVWAAYITKADFPIKICEGLGFYSPEFFHNQDDRFAKDIEMFVTVTSSPHAYITSHMGIASTLEGLTTRQKGTSLDLHSFAAKVMLNRNPDRRSMVNAPVFAMEQIIIKALPNDIFVGTRQMRKRMQAAQGVGFREYCSRYREDCRKGLLNKAEEEALRKKRISTAKLTDYILVTDLAKQSRLCVKMLTT